MFNLIKKKTKKKAKFIQYTKVAVTSILVAGIIWITWSYILATISVLNGDSQPLESLSKQVCVTLLGTCLGYFCKSYIENYSKKKAELQEMVIKTETIDETTSSDAVG